MFRGPINDEMPIRIECHHGELAEPGYLRYLLEQFLANPATHKCRIEHLVWIPCHNHDNLKRIIKVSSATLKMFIVDGSKFDEKVLEYLAKKCPQLEGLSAGRNTPS